MKLIKEQIDPDSIEPILEEGKNGERSLYLKGIFLQSNIVNGNKRMYPEEIMDKEVARYIKEKVDKNMAMGELGHPDTPKLNLERTSHLIVELKKDGTNYVGKAKILDTPFGQTAAGLIKGGARLGVSSRAVGSLKSNNKGVNVVQDDFMLSTAADIVADPSAPDAVVDSIMEGKDWVYVNGTFMEADIEKMKKQISSASSRQLQEVKYMVAAKFLRGLGN